MSANGDYMENGDLHNWLYNGELIEANKKRSETEAVCYYSLLSIGKSAARANMHCLMASALAANFVKFNS